LILGRIALRPAAISVHYFSDNETKPALEFLAVQQVTVALMSHSAAPS
jgi:hypothetical protein